MTILLSGGTGFIGGLLVQALTAQGHSVSLLMRRPPSVPLPNGVHAVMWEGRPTKRLVDAMEQADAVVNLAGVSVGGRRWTRDRKRDLIGSRVESTHAIVEAMVSSVHRPRVFVNASASGYYGNAGSVPLTETHPPGRDFLADLCVQWELAARQAEPLGVRVVLPRMGVVLSSHGGALSQMAFPLRFFLGGPLGPGTQWFPWVHCDDVVGAIIFALGSTAVAGPFNLVAPEAVTMDEFAGSLAKALRRPSWVRVPEFALRMVLGEMAEMILGSQRLVPEVLINAGYTFLHPTLRGALADIYRKKS